MIVDVYPKGTPINRIVCWWSAGATSAVATKIVIDEWDGQTPLEIVYCDTGGEHPDNERFIKDCEKWYGHPIKVLKNPQYNDIWEVFEKRRYLAGIGGAPCTTQMKKEVRYQYQDAEHDLQIFGFDNGERKRMESFSYNHPDVRGWYPLIERDLSKDDCLKQLASAGIELPVMYRLGYRNNNCIGCVKGGMGYWNKIRRDFPDVFERMSELEQRFNVAICKSYAGDGKRKRVFLKDLKPDQGRYDEIETESMKCGLICDY